MTDITYFDEKETILYHCHLVLNTRNRKKALSYAKSRNFIDSAGQPTIVGQSLALNTQFETNAMKSNVVRNRFRSLLAAE